MAITPNPHSAEQMRLARGHRIELILLGMALARDGDRERILSEIDPEQLHSEIACQILRSLVTKSPQDRDQAREGLRQWGIEVESDGVLPPVVERVKDDHARRQFNTAISTARSVEDLHEAVSEVLAVISG